MDTNRVKEWWNTTAKDDTVIQDIIKGKIVINEYTLFPSSGHIAAVSARKDGEETIQLFNCGDVNTYEEFKDCLKEQLNSTTVGGKRKTRRNRKSKKSRKGKSIKNRRKSNRRRR
jgi:hypothetical protein